MNKCGFFLRGPVGRRARGVRGVGRRGSWLPVPDVCCSRGTDRVCFAVSANGGSLIPFVSCKKKHMNKLPEDPICGTRLHWPCMCEGRTAGGCISAVLAMLERAATQDLKGFPAARGRPDPENQAARGRPDPENPRWGASNPNFLKGFPAVLCTGAELRKARLQIWVPEGSLAGVFVRHHLALELVCRADLSGH